MTLFFGGLIIGSAITLFAMSMCIAAGRADDQAERYYKEKNNGNHGRI